MTNTKYDTTEYLKSVDAYWRAATYLSVGQLFLMDNPLLRRELKTTDVKPKPIGHWGTIAPQNFIYAHLNRVIQKYDLNMFYIEGSGHGGQVMVSNSYLDGSYSDIYPRITQDEQGMQRLFKQFSFPGGVASHAAPETPGSIHEGGELGYSLSHGTGAILDNPDVIAAVEIGDGEAETGPLAASWFSDKFINPIHDGAVLPILQINGFKISNPTVLSRMSDEDLTKYFEGMGWEPHIVNVHGKEPMEAHKIMAAAMDDCIEKIKAIQKNARENHDDSLPIWPMIILRAPKGWTGPKKDLDGNPIENSFRAHQVPIPVSQDQMEHKDLLINWMESYKPEELFDENGYPTEIVRQNIPDEQHRMSTNPITNGGIHPKTLNLPDYRDFALDVEKQGRGQFKAEDMVTWGKYLAEVEKLNPTNFRAFGPDETKSNKLFQMLDDGKRQWMEEIHEPNDENMAHAGRNIDSQLSEHQCEGWLEGYVLTGRHGMFASYEAFTRVIDSMLTQHFKWIRKADELDWHHDYPSLNIVNASNSFQQDHNGYTHQDPGMLTHMAEKKGKYVREYTPCDTNTLLAVGDKAFTERNVINLMVTSKHPRFQWFTADEARELVTNGLKYVDWASTDQDAEPDIVIASAGTEPTTEAMAAVSILHEAFPELKIRTINVVDILRLRSPEIDPRGLLDEEFDGYFTKDKPVIFAFHGFEDLLQSMFFNRHNHNLHAHGYREEGDITTPFDMRVLNHLDRFHLAKDAIMHVPGYKEKAASFVQKMDDMINKHHQYIRDHGKDMPEVTKWRWKDVNQK